MKILYVGPLEEGGTCRMRLRALEDLGHEVLPIDTAPPGVEKRGRGLLPRILHRMGRPLDLAGANEGVLAGAAACRPDVVWVDKGLTIRPETLRGVRESAPSALLVSYSPDDMAARHNQSRAYLAGIPIYDVHFTTKTYNLDELRALGARRVLFVGNAFCPHTHRPLPVTEEDRRTLGGPVGFIGAFEAERAAAMVAVARAGIEVRIWGGRAWRAFEPRGLPLRVESRPLWGDEYAKAICSFDINLCFLRRLNRDRQTQRSMEIPACGGFMLAERTDEHRGLFEEGMEAEFFGSIEELVEKVRHYLSHEDARRQIARAGRERCLRSGYDYPSRMRWMLEQMVAACAG